MSNDEVFKEGWLAKQFDGVRLDVRKIPPRFRRTEDQRDYVEELIVAAEKVVKVGPNGDKKALQRAIGQLRRSVKLLREP